MVRPPEAPSAGRRPSPGSRPDPTAPRLYRALLRTCRGLARVLGLRLRFEGAEHLPHDAHGRPTGGWIALGVPHRTWIDPFVLATLLPAEPRLVFLGDGRAIYRSRFRRWLFARIGGVVPIWPSGGRRAFAAHLDAAGSVLASGAVFALFPEVGPPVPVDRARPFGGGIGYFAIRSGAPVVPLVLGGTDELFLGRRIILRALPPVTAESLVVGPTSGPGTAGSEAWPPAPDTPAEREAARVVTRALERYVAADVAACHRLVEPRPGARRPLRGLTHLFR